VGPVSADVEPRVRREPPAFRRLAVAGSEGRTPHLVRVTLTGPELDGFEPPLPGGSVRLLLPDGPHGELVIPVWNGNAFFHADGRRPLVRTLTPLRHDPVARELDVEVVRHGDGALSDWVSRVAPGDLVAISGPGRGYAIDPDATSFLFGGDESALPALGQLVAALPPDARAVVMIEIARPDARLDLPAPPGAEVRWLVRSPGSGPGDVLVAAVLEEDVSDEARVWLAGEAASMQRLRRHLFGALGLSRTRATVRGYWKHGRRGDEGDEGDGRADA
jgi:NADPH-dependent ferric siderophore reductase